MKNKLRRLRKKLNRFTKNVCVKSPMFEEVVNIHELNNSTKIFVGTFLLNLSLESGQINLNKLKLNEVEETEDKTSLELKIRETKYFITFIDEKKVEVFKSLFILKNFI
ncbi:hypothetical protein CDIK_1350, partial [Cucumispora dikerogammari]